MAPKGPNMAQLRALNERLTEQLEVAERERDVARAEAKRALELVNKLRKQQQVAANVQEPKTGSIRAHLLPAHMARYTQYLASGCQAALWAHLVPTLKWRNQDVAKVNAYFVKMKEIHPELGRYNNNWVSKRIAVQYFQNRRRAIARAAEAEEDDDEDDDENMDGDEESDDHE